MRRTRIILAAVALAAAITTSTAPAALAGGGGGGGGSICDGFARGDEVHMLDSCFAGTAQLVEPTTDTITVSNDGEIAHTITAIGGDFDLYLESGESATLELPDDAVIPVYCTLHGTTSGAGMAGVIVRDGDAGVSPAAADETAAAANLLAAADAAEEQDSDGLALVAIIVAGLAAAFSLLAVTFTVGARRTAKSS